MSDDDDLAWPSPRNNPDLVGHDKAEAEFLAGFNAGRLHHAWLICGPRGIGKATLAYRMARFLLTRPVGDADAGPSLFGDDLPAADPDSLFVDPEHPVFKRLSSGGHADFKSIERAADPKTHKLRKEIVVGDVRGIGGFLSMTPAEGGWRVVVIDSADEMNMNAANGVLKILEEPPKRAILLLVSHNPGRLLPTIRSRCRRLSLGPLDDDEVDRLLAGYMPELSADERAGLGQLAEGSIGRALEFAGESGLQIYQEMSQVFAALPKLDIPGLHRLGDKIARDNTGDAFHMARDVINHWLNQRVKSGASNGGATPAGLEQWVEVWEKTNQLFRQADSINLDRKQVILNTFLSIEAAARA